MGKVTQLQISGFDDRSIQKILRETDSMILARAMKGASEDVKGVILRNMSKRAAELILEEIEEVEAGDLRSQEAAVGKINDIIARLIDAGEIIRMTESPESTERSPYAIGVDTSSVFGMRKGILELADKARNQGLLALEEDVSDTDDRLLAKGLQLIVDGTDPNIVERLISREIETFEQLERLKIKEEIYRREKVLADALTLRRMKRPRLEIT